MTDRSRIASQVLRVIQVTAALAVIAVAANPRLAAVAASAAASVWATRIRYSGFAAGALLAAVGCFSILIPGR